MGQIISKQEDIQQQQNQLMQINAKQRGKSILRQQSTENLKKQNQDFNNNSTSEANDYFHSEHDMFAIKVFQQQKDIDLKMFTKKQMQYIENQGWWQPKKYMRPFKLSRQNSSSSNQHQTDKSFENYNGHNLNYTPSQILQIQKIQDDNDKYQKTMAKLDQDMKNKQIVQIPSLEVYPRNIKNVKFRKARSVDPIDNPISTVFSKQPKYYFFNKPKNHDNKYDSQIVRRNISLLNIDPLHKFKCELARTNINIQILKECITMLQLYKDSQQMGKCNYFDICTNSNQFCVGIEMENHEKVKITIIWSNSNSKINEKMNKILKFYKLSHDQLRIVDDFFHRYVGRLETYFLFFTSKYVSVTGHDLIIKKISMNQKNDKQNQNYPQLDTESEQSEEDFNQRSPQRKISTQNSDQEPTKISKFDSFLGRIQKRLEKKKNQGNQIQNITNFFNDFAYKMGSQYIQGVLIQLIELYDYLIENNFYFSGIKPQNIEILGSQIKIHLSNSFLNEHQEYDAQQMCQDLGLTILSFYLQTDFNALKVIKSSMIYSLIQQSSKIKEDQKFMLNIIINNFDFCSNNFQNLQQLYKSMSQFQSTKQIFIDQPHQTYNYLLDNKNIFYIIDEKKQLSSYHLIFNKQINDLKDFMIQDQKQNHILKEKESQTNVMHLSIIKEQDSLYETLSNQITAKSINKHSIFDSQFQMYQSQEINNKQEIQLVQTQEQINQNLSESKQYNNNFQIILEEEDINDCNVQSTFNDLTNTFQKNHKIFPWLTQLQKQTSCQDQYIQAIPINQIKYPIIRKQHFKIDLHCMTDETNRSFLHIIYREKNDRDQSYYASFLILKNPHSDQKFNVQLKKVISLEHYYQPGYILEYKKQIYLIAGSLKRQFLSSKVYNLEYKQKKSEFQTLNELNRGYKQGHAFNIQNKLVWLGFIDSQTQQYMYLEVLNSNNKWIDFKGKSKSPLYDGSENVIFYQIENKIQAINYYKKKYQEIIIEIDFENQKFSYTNIDLKISVNSEDKRFQQLNELKNLMNCQCNHKFDGSIIKSIQLNANRQLSLSNIIFLNQGRMYINTKALTDCIDQQNEQKEMVVLQQIEINRNKEHFDTFFDQIKLKYLINDKRILDIKKINILNNYSQNKKLNIVQFLYEKPDISLTEFMNQMNSQIPFHNFFEIYLSLVKQICILQKYKMSFVEISPEIIFIQYKHTKPKYFLTNFEYQNRLLTKDISYFQYKYLPKNTQFDSLETLLSSNMYSLGIMLVQIYFFQELKKSQDYFDHEKISQLANSMDLPFKIHLHIKQMINADKSHRPSAEVCYKFLKSCQELFKIKIYKLDQHQISDKQTQTYNLIDNKIILYDAAKQQIQKFKLNYNIKNLNSICYDQKQRIFYLLDQDLQNSFNKLSLKNCMNTLEQSSQVSYDIVDLEQLKQPPFIYEGTWNFPIIYGDEMVWKIGGMEQGSNGLQKSEQCFRYDIKNNKWKKIKQLLFPAFHTNLIFSNLKIYGFEVESILKKRYLVTDIYCTVLDSWSRIKISFKETIPLSIIDLGFGVNADQTAFLFSTDSCKKQNINIFGQEQIKMLNFEKNYKLFNIANNISNYKTRYTKLIYFQNEFNEEEISLFEIYYQEI